MGRKPTTDKPNVHLDKELHRKVSEYATRNNKLIKDATADLISLALDKVAYVEKRFPELKYIGAQYNELTIDDRKRQRHVTVRVRDSRLECEVHPAGECEHIEFLKQRGELAKVVFKR